MGTLCRIWCLLLSFVACSIATNVERWPVYFTTPELNVVRKSYAADAKEEENKTSPIYFGQSINLLAQVEMNDSFVMLVGSPLAEGREHNVSHDYLGRIHSYKIEPTLFSGKNVSLTSTSPQGVTLGDGLGTTIVSAPDGNAVACSPSQLLHCGNDIYEPGYCSKSSHYGRNWTEAQILNNTRCPITHVDLLFVLDGSASVNGSWDTVKDWVLAITRQLDLASGSVSVGVVEYSYYWKTEKINEQTYIKTEIEIGQHKTFAEFKNKLDKVPLYAFNTQTGHALQKVVFDFNSTKDFGKIYNKQVMVLVTDGKSTDSELVPAAAKNIRDMGIFTYAIGVNQTGDTINITEIEIIANGGSAGMERVIIVDSFDDLTEIVNELRTEIQSGVLEGSSDKTKSIYFAEVGLSGAYSKRINDTWILELENT